jgi:hypothetical protein
MTTPERQPGVDRTALVVVSTFDDSEDKAYWKSRTPSERLEHLELLRQINYGDEAAGGLQRVLEIVRAPWS